MPHAARFPVLLLVSGFIFLAGCRDKGLKKANVDLVEKGMAKKQVESILGLPTSSETIDFSVLKRTTYVYAQGKDTITIVFKDDRVESKESTLAE